MREEKELTEEQKEELEEEQKELHNALNQTISQLITITQDAVMDLSQYNIITNYNIEQLLQNIKNNLLTIKFLKQNINQ